jgi:hypothetical protein
MFHIIISFALAYLFAQISMDFGGMGLLNLMSLFIILGMYLVFCYNITVP